MSQELKIATQKSLFDPAAAMASVSESAEATISILFQKCHKIIHRFGSDSAVRSMSERIDSFDNDLRCLRVFLDCIHKWTDLEDVLELGSLVNKVEATIQKIAEKLIQNKKKLRSGFPTLTISKKKEDRSHKLKAWKLHDLLCDLMGEVMDLKLEIKEAYASLSLKSQSFQLQFEYGDWGNFGEFLDHYSRACCRVVELARSTRGRDGEIKRFNDLLLKCKGFLDCVARDSSRNRRITDAMIHVGKVAISAALQLCEWWVCEWLVDQDNAGIAFLEFHKKIDLADPEFVDMNLKLLRKDQRNRLEYLVDEFFKSHGIPFSLRIHSFENPFPEEGPTTFEKELKPLLISVLRSDAKNVQCLLADVKVVLTQVPKAFNFHLDESKDVVCNLLPEIWLIKIEVLLRKHLDADFTLPKLVHNRAQSFAQELRYLKYDRLLKSLKTQIEYSRDGNINKMKQILNLMEEVGNVAASLEDSIFLEEYTGNKETVTSEFFKLLLMIVLFKANSLFINFHHHNNNGQSSVFFNKDQIETLQKGLDFLTVFVKDQPVAMFVKNQPAAAQREEKLKQIEEVAYGVTSLYRSLPTNQITEEAVNNVKILISDEIEKIRLVMVKLKDIYLHAPRINFPKTNRMGFIDSLLEKLTELQKVDLAVSLKHQIEEILGNLKFLAPFLKGMLEQDIQSQELKDLGARIVDVAYEAEYCIDLMMLEDTVNWKNLLWLYHLLEDIRLMKSNVTTAYNKIRQSKGHILPQTLVPKAAPLRIDETVVVLSDQEGMIIDRLIRGTRKLDIVPIVGMPGIGKTTLARRVYNSPSVVYHFHIRTWCCVSEIYRKKEVLLEILSHITPLKDDILQMSDEDLQMSDEDLQNKLRQLLLKNRYLIVMDDMWNPEALDDLGSSLPNDENGSRILITSRDRRVVTKANPHANPHFLRQLSETESWNLFQIKIFHKELFPEELREIGEQITKRCKGLPLAIVAIAGLLQKRERKYSSWKGIAEDLSSIVDNPHEQCPQILELSYKHLPDYLKACFLYCGAFPEDQDIPTRKLMQLWIAEGFVQKTESKSLEDVANDYLMDLIDRSLVLFSQRRSIGGVKACRVHDLLRKLCLRKAKDDKFLQVIMRMPDEYDASRHAFIANSSSPSSSLTYEDYRLCYCSKREHFVDSRPSGPHVRSLLCFASGDDNPKCPYNISFISDNFRLLKVLDLECIYMDTSFPSGIELLVHLRYLAVAGYIDYVPSSIANLWNLEMFVVKGLKGKVKLPNSIWSLKKLRHLQVTDVAFISLLDEQQENSSGLTSLVTLSSPLFCSGEDTEKILRQFLNLQKLKCIFSESWDNSQECNQFPSLRVLVKLESLKISYNGRALHPSEFSFPLNLKKLTLSNFRLPWTKISVIGQLPSLEVLKLLPHSFDGERWDMVEGEFSELKYLKLDTLNIAKWNVCSNHLPKLQQLVLRCCRHLKEVPSSIVEIPTLEMINVQWCGDGVEESMKPIMEEGDGRLKIFINFAEMEFSST